MTRAARPGLAPVLSLVLLLAGSGAPLASAGDPPAESEAAVRRMLRTARTGSPTVRPQAAARLVSLGKPAADLLLDECGDGPHDMAGLGPEVVEVLGRFGDERLRAKLWEAIGDRDFPWRPAAARSLAHAPVESEADRFVALLEDALAPVRVAAIHAVERLDHEPAKGRVRNLFDDPSDRVRRAAARLLDVWGHRKALAWIVEDLGREDRFFLRETGRAARYEAIRIVEERLGDRFGYEPSKPPAENREAIARIRARLDEITGGSIPALSPVAVAGVEPPGSFLGLEIRSCRKGEIALRVTEDDVLLLGTGNPARVSLPKGTAKALRGVAREALPAFARGLHGKPGCDREEYTFVDAAGGIHAVRVSKGPEPVADLRPEPLDRIAAALVAVLPASGDDARVAELRRRTREALEAVGGTLPAQSAAK